MEGPRVLSHTLLLLSQNTTMSSSGGCHHRVDEHEEMYLFSIKSLIISCDHLYLDGKHEPHVWRYAILTEHALSKLKFVEVK